MQIQGPNKIFKGGWHTYQVIDTSPLPSNTQYAWSTLGIATEHARETKDNKLTFYIDDLNLRDNNDFIIYCNVHVPNTTDDDDKHTAEGRSYNLRRTIQKSPPPTIEVKELKAKFTTTAKNGMLPKNVSILHIDPSQSSVGSGLKYTWMFDTEHKRVHITKQDNKPFDINVDQMMVDPDRGSQGYLNLYMKLSVGEDPCNSVYEEQRIVLVDR